MKGSGREGYCVSCVYCVLVSQTPGADPDDDDLLLSDLERKADLRSALAAELRR